MMGAVMLTGLIRGIYRFQTTMQMGPALMDIGIGTGSWHWDCG